MAIINELDLDNIGIQPDIFHMNISEASIADALRATGKYIKHVHMNETNHYSFGSGHADYKAIMKTLKEINFTGCLAIYMPYTTQEIFNMGSQGYGKSGSFATKKGLVRPDLKSYLETPIKYLKEIENILDSSTKTYEMDTYCESGVI